MKYDSTKVRGVVELSFGFYTKPRFLYTYTECFGMSFRRRGISFFCFPQITQIFEFYRT